MKLLESFMKTIRDRGLLTDFISEIFGYKDFHDYNYMFRLSMKDNDVIIDIYDNISEYRFNRYIFSYSKGKYKTSVIDEDGVFVTYIDVLNASHSDNKLYMLAYMTTLDKDRIIDYASSFLSNKYIEVLKEIIK